MDGMTAPARAVVDDPLNEALAEIAAAAPVHDSDGSFPFESLDLLHAHGLLALTARRDDGGAEAGLAEAAHLVGRVGEACASTALVLAMQLTHLAASRRSPAWPERVRAMLGRSAGRYGALVNALRVEPELGTPARGGLPATVARRTATGWQVTGRKIFSTGAPALSWGLVWARTDEARPRTGLVLVPMRAPGVAVEETWDQLGLRASGSHDVVLRDVEVPEEYALDLRPPESWSRPDPYQAAWNAALVGTLYTGVARAARDWLAGFLRGRVPTNLGAPLATLPRMQDAAGRIEALLVTNRRLVDGIAREHDAAERGEAPPPSATECGLVKQVACENAIQAVQLAAELTGNAGLARRNPLERHLRDVLCARIHTPQADAAYGAAGRAALLA